MIMLNVWLVTIDNVHNFIYLYISYIALLVLVNVLQLLPQILKQCCLQKSTLCTQKDDDTVKQTMANRLAKTVYAKLLEDHVVDHY